MYACRMLFIITVSGAYQTFMSKDSQTSDSCVFVLSVVVCLYVKLRLPVILCWKWHWADCTCLTCSQPVDEAKRGEPVDYSKIGCRRTLLFKGQARCSYLQAAFLPRS